MGTNRISWLFWVAVGALCVNPRHRHVFPLRSILSGPGRPRGSSRELYFKTDLILGSGKAKAMRASYYVTFSMVGFGAMAVFLLGIGLRGFLTKRPFLFSAKWLLLFMVVVFLGPIVTLIPSPFPFSRPWQFTNWLPILMFPVMAVFFWLQMRGYLAFGITGKSFREGLVAALEKLQLPYEESLSSIRLTSVEADLQVAVQSWMGTGQIRVRQGRHGPLLKKIVQAMNERFRASPVENQYDLLRLLSDPGDFCFHRDNGPGVAPRSALTPPEICALNLPAKLLPQTDFP